MALGSKAAPGAVPVCLCVHFPWFLLVSSQVTDTEQGGVMCVVSPHLNGPALPEAIAAVIVLVENSHASRGKTFCAVLCRFDLVVKIVNDCISKSVRMLCV